MYIRVCVLWYYYIRLGCVLGYVYWGTCIRVHVLGMCTRVYCMCIRVCGMCIVVCMCIGHVYWGMCIRVGILCTRACLIY